MIGIESKGAASNDPATMLPVLLTFMLVALLLAGLSYVCFRCIKKSKDKKNNALGDAEVNGSLLEAEENDNEQQEETSISQAEILP